MTSVRKSTIQKQAAFLEAFAVTGNISKAAKAAGVCRTSTNKWRKQPGFQARMDEAHAAAHVEVMKEVRRRAINGVQKPVMNKGQPVYVMDPKTGDFVPLVEHVYSDTLLIFLAKQGDPEQLCDRARTAKIERRWRRMDVMAGDDTGSVAAADVVNLLAKLAGAKAGGADTATT